jgi:ABC-type glycerol-3-phosphate transport system substrate-binding protein
MKKLLWLFAVILMITNCSQKESLDSAITPEDLARNFVAPPASAKPHTWWHWMNGNITKEGIDRKSVV